jgi:phenylacetate-CoA ligase
MRATLSAPHPRRRPLAIRFSPGSVVALTMPMRFAWWAVLGAVARGAHRLSRTSLPALRLGARHGAGLAHRLAAPAAAATARRALRRTPAYAAFGAGHGRPRPCRSAADWVAQLPITTKATYVDRWSLAERCTGGRLPSTGCQLDESAGSSGRPYTWARGRAELADVERSLALIARHLLPDDGAPIVTLNAFSMGAWATGTTVSAALTRIGTVKSCGPDVDKVLGALQLLGPDPTYVVCGYPPFLRTLLDEAAARGIDLSRYRMHGFVGGEGMTEAARSRLERVLVRAWSAYGASDLDIGVAAETPLSVWLRQQAAVDPDLAVALFGRADRLPMVFQYDPLDYHVEVVASSAGSTAVARLVVTVNRQVLSPRVRYDVGDEGGTIDHDRAMAVCRAVGLDPGAAEADPFRLPLLFVHGRADQTLSFMGANLYPEDVAVGLATDPAADRLGAFCLELADVGDDEVRPIIHVESSGETDTERLAGSVRTHLAEVSADYRSALAESDDAADLRVRLWPPGTGPFVADATRIKHRVIVEGVR